MERGQVTIIMILGLSILVLTILGLYYSSVIQESLFARSRSDQQLSSDTLKTYVESCMGSAVQNAIIEKAKHGFGDIQYDGKSIWATPTDYYPKSASIVGDAIATETINTITQCIANYPLQSDTFDIAFGQPSMNVSIGLDKIDVYLNYPMELTTPATTTQLNTFHATVSERVGLLLRLGHALANEAHNGQPIDVDTLMLSRGSDLFVAVDRPYPYTVFSITDRMSSNDLELGFVVEQTDIFGLQEQAPTGCCTAGIICAEGITQTSCLAAQGIFSSQSSCSCPDLLPKVESFTETPCADGQCDNCGRQYKHGDSACVFESVGVGGRFYDYACIDGQLKIEPCGDYRTDVCAQTKVGDNSVALCRQNRAQSCSSCTDASCCNDPQKDCVFASGMCLPKVPVGSPFWQAQTAQTCLQDVAVTCTNCTAEQNAQQLIRACNALGDCGPTLNPYGSLGGNLLGSSSSVDEDDVRSVLQERGVYASNLTYLSSNPTTVATNTGEFSSRISLILYYVQELGKVQVSSFDDFSNPEKNIRIQPSESSFCSAYQAPQEDVCSYCASMATCSEYACKSLGDDCVYDDGICSTASLATSNVSVSLSVDQTYENSSLEDNSTNTIIPVLDLQDPISAFDPLHINILTNDSVSCSLSALPVPLSYARWTSSSNISLVLGDDLLVLEKLLFVFDEVTFDELMPKIVDAYYTLEKLQLQHPGISRFSAGYRPLLQPFVEYYVAHQNNQLVQQLLADAQTGKYHAFVHCMHNGVSNVAGAVRFSVDNSCNQQLTPRIVQHTQSDLIITTNIPAQCAASSSIDQFNADTVSSCTTTMATSNGYLCRITNPTAQLYVQCTSQPETERRMIDVQINGTDIVNTGVYAPSFSVVDGKARFYQDGTLSMCSSSSLDLYCGLQYCEFAPVDGEHSISCWPLSSTNRCSYDGLVSNIIMSNQTTVLPLGEIVYNVDTDLLTISGTNNYRCSATVDGISVVISGGRIDASFEPGRHLAEVSCRDAYGGFMRRQLQFDVALD